MATSHADDFSTTSGTKAPAQKGYEDVEYTCPMHPQIRQIGPGNCPICGMALEPVVATGEAGPSPELKDFTRRFWVGLALSIPLILLEMGGHLIGLGLDGRRARDRLDPTQPLRRQRGRRPAGEAGLLRAARHPLRHPPTRPAGRSARPVEHRAARVLTVRSRYGARPEAFSGRTAVQEQGGGFQQQANAHR